MSETRHTPGPWHECKGAVVPDLTSPGQALNGGYVICQGFLGPDAAGNTALVVAAPDLLIATEMLLGTIEAFRQASDDPDDLYTEIVASEHILSLSRAAAARARGETNDRV